MKTSEILANARARVARGWCKEVGIDGNGNVCIVGALTQAEDWAKLRGVNLADLPTFPYLALNQSLSEFGGYVSVVAFNDARATTQQDVLNLFDKTICSLEERGE